MKPSATSELEMAARYMLARPVDSEMVAARAPWRVKCPVART
jgi:hypothetical protein